ncbi:MAG TPA: hypothetical protein VH020_11585 [Stellaceae bacterium]|jgi:hypothetical protein|nr:hypothetical protein [Stellaceae bacterium]
MTINPWDILEPEGAENDPAKLYASVGHALSAWEWMEQQFAHFFGFFCGEADTLPARRAYGAVVTFRGRADMMRAAASAFFYQRPKHEMKERFEDLLNRACNFSPRRNEIAHGIVAVVYYEMADSEDFKSKDLLKIMEAARWLLAPPEYATNKNMLVPIGDDEIRRTRRKYAYSCKEIDHYRAQFKELQDSLWQLTLDWSERYPAEDILPPL